MGLKTFVGDRPHLKDAVIAKNYLDEKELRAMGQIVSGYLDFAERQAERHQTMTMKDWVKHLDKILAMSEKIFCKETARFLMAKHWIKRQANTRSISKGH